MYISELNTYCTYMNATYIFIVKRVVLMFSLYVDKYIITIIVITSLMLSCCGCMCIMFCCCCIQRENYDQYESTYIRI